MVNLSAMAEASTSIPDDTVWNEGETQVLRTGGCEAAKAIAQLLKEQCGATVSEPTEELEHGWFFKILFKAQRIDFQVVDVGEVMIIADNLGAPKRSMEDQRSVMLELLFKLDEALKADPRFGSPLWWSRDKRGNTNGPGAAEPVLRDVPTAGRPAAGGFELLRRWLGGWRAGRR